MKHSIRLAFPLGIILLVLSTVFVSIVNASPEVDSARFSIPQRMAVMQPPPPVTYTLTINIVGSGTVTQKDLTHGTTTSISPMQYLSGTMVSLTATPNPGASFVGWTGDPVTGTNPATIKMDANKTVTATFTAPVCFNLLANASPGAGGNVGVSPSPNCGGSQYGSATIVTLTANANAGYAFGSWTVGASGTTNPVTVTMNSDKTVTANFTICYSLATSVSPTGSGSVTVNTAANCNGGLYKSGTSVSLTANPSSGYGFSNWSGGASGSANTTSVAMTTNTSATANFVLSPPPAQPSATNTAAPQTSAPLVTITPLLQGGVATVTPTPTTHLPVTGDSPFTWIAIGLVLVLIVVGARVMRQSSS